MAELAAEIVVPGEPVPWQRARRKGNRYFTDPKVSEYQERVQSAWLVEGRPSFADSPVELTATFVVSRKESHLRKDGGLRTTAPQFPPRVDLDNLVKGVLDSLNGKAFHDDSQVVSYWRVVKRYAAGGEEPHTEIELRAV